MLSNLAVSTHSGGISVAMEGREKSPSVANSGCYVLALFGVVLASPQYRTLLRFRPSAFSTTHFMLVTLYLVPRETSSDLTFGVDGDKPLKRERLHFVFKSQKLKGLLVLDLSIVEDLKESKRNISVKFLSA